MMRGAIGVVTDGGFRDAARIGELDIPAYHTRPSSPTNLTNNEAIAITSPPLAVMHLSFPAIIVGDEDSVIVVPAHLAEEVASEATEMTIYEDFVVGLVKTGTSIIGLYPCTNPEFEASFAA